MTYQSGELEDLALFVAVVDAGGFSAAARALGTRKALISRRVQALEQRLGARLLERTTRAVRVTEIGAALHERAAQAVALAREATRLVDARREEPVGRLRISATQLLADLVLRPVVLAYLRRYPRASIELDVSSRQVDIVREGFDLALRVGPPQDSNLVGRLLGKGRTVCLASPKYLARTTTPARPQDLEQHDAVIVAGGPAEWSFERGKTRIVVRPSVRLATPSYDLVRASVIAGFGLARLPSYYVADDIAAGRLQVLLDEWTPPEVAVMAVYASRDLLAPKTRAFLDMLGDHVAQHPLPVEGG